MNRTLLRGLFNENRTPFADLRGLLFRRGRGGPVLLKVVLRVRFGLRVFYLNLKVSFLIEFFAIEATHVI